ncbi:MAG: PadR family transcriptional regulator [Desulfotomaculaceae bacterium]|nr:PadR family transcriptional regulator [Desulfotomaculaceae bacterium]
MNVSKELIAASATPLLLAILKAGDSYGYAIIKRVKEMSNNELIWSEGMLYPVLHRLEEQGLIESYWYKSEAGRQRKYYRIKERGLQELEIQRKQWEVVVAALAKTWSEGTIHKEG